MVYHGYRSVAGHPPVRSSCLPITDMAMKLHKLSLQGYKTFASRTEFVFDDGITAIVGPNGSGKSNIADALRWVLGEQSYSTCLLYTSRCV